MLIKFQSTMNMVINRRKVEKIGWQISLCNINVFKFVNMDFGIIVFFFVGLPFIASR